IFLLVLAVFITLQWLVVIVRVTGISMEPTLRDGEIKVVNRLAYRSRSPQRGDIVSIGELKGQRDMYMKRVVALPGETFLIRNGYVHVNGERIEEPYVLHRASWYHPQIVLGSDEYMVIGDNRGMHITDHKFGRVERQFIVGKLWF
ncbi:MAG TPA: signal peptidase I, partial [Verrucomicrobiales bacterium]|nr:signal peptidase I [Verrucomicrobiales bacterium]